MRNIFSLGVLLTAASAQAAVNDVLPGTYFPLATGSSTVAVYTFDRQAQGPYKNGAKQIDGRLDTQIAALWATHFMAVRETPVALTAILPWSQNSVNPAPLAGMIGKEARGLGDLRFGTTIWPLADRTSGESLGVSGFVFLPTGDYNNRQVLNVGENRYKLAFNAGWIRPLSSAFILDVLPEMVWFGDNADYVSGKKLVQKPAYTLTSYLRYRASPNWQFHLGAQINRGGETQINHIDQDNAPNNARVMLGTTFLTDNKSNQLMLRVAKDTQIKNGFETTSEVMLRYMNRF